VGRTVDFSPEQVHFLQYGRVADTSAAAAQLGFTPKWTSLPAFEDFASPRLVALRPPPARAVGPQRSRCPAWSTRRWPCCAAPPAGSPAGGVRGTPRGCPGESGCPDDPTPLALPGPHQKERAPP